MTRTGTFLTLSSGVNTMGGTVEPTISMPCTPLQTGFANGNVPVPFLLRLLDPPVPPSSNNFPKY